MRFTRLGGSIGGICSQPHCCNAFLIKIGKIALIKVVDLFAGCGGLAEGFATLQSESGHVFRVVLSAERDRHAIESLKLRAFVRLCRERGRLPASYFDFLRGTSTVHYSERDAALWEAATREALRVDLGKPEGAAALAEAISLEVGRDDTWVLIGGPPCQAFSLVGRSRNRGIANYRPEDDERYFLYRAYLGALTRDNAPLAFVLENVTGMRSAHVAGERVFSGILRDLSDPGRALDGRTRAKYRIHSLTSPQVVFCPGGDPSLVDPSAYIVQSERYGVPQARHRVILVGVREDLHSRPALLMPSQRGSVPVQAVIGHLPSIRSPSSDKNRPKIGDELLLEFASAEAKGLRGEMTSAQWQRMREVLRVACRSGSELRGERFTPLASDETFGSELPPQLRRWLEAPRLHGVIDHSARPHMPADLIRYLYCTTYTESMGRSPTSRGFPRALAPNHKSWETGNFGDRFRVQLRDRPATTITSHLAKDGHYFIHPDPWQIRSLTVRGAARLQTFPDDYFFSGPRTAKYLQVGNAVPPFLARQIAAALYPALS
jgi:DNA (cytosine-5)-methyltransferase 1